MSRSITCVCIGICFFNCSVSFAQALPKNPTVQQVVSYQLYQQKQWSLKQLPKNSVLYQYNTKYVFKSPLTSSFRSDLSYINSSKKKLTPHLTISEKIQLAQKNTINYHYKYEVSCYGKIPTERRAILGSEFLEREKTSFSH